MSENRRLQGGDFFDSNCTALCMQQTMLEQSALTTQYSINQTIKTFQSFKVRVFFRYSICKLRLSSKTWKPTTSPWMKQLMWLKLMRMFGAIHS